MVSSASLFVFGTGRIGFQRRPVASAGGFCHYQRQVLTVNGRFERAEALAVQGDKIVTIGRDKAISPFIGAKTHVLDAGGKMVLPGLIDSLVHSYRAALSELGGRKPVLTSLAQAFTYIRKQAAKLAPGDRQRC